MAELEVSKRFRINISTSVKGVKTYDCTVDIERKIIGGGEVDTDNEYQRQEILAESYKLTAELDKRYPPSVEEKK